MEQTFAEERHRMMDVEPLRFEALQQQIQTMFAYIQGLGASVNYKPPPTVSVASASSTSTTVGLHTDGISFCSHSRKYKCNWLHEPTLNIDSGI